MSRKIRIYGSDIKKAIKKTIKEQYEMGDAYRRSPKRGGKFKKLPREKGIEDVFGVYGEEMPPAIIRYMRKNPKYIIQRLYDLYGKEVFDKYIPRDSEFTLGDVETIESGKLYGGDDEFEMDFEDELIDEVEEKKMTQKIYSPNEVDKAEQEGVGIEVDGTVIPTKDGGLKVTTMNEEEWIQKAIKKPGSLRKKMDLDKSEKMTKTDINKEISKLKKKDKDPEKKGVQGLSKRDLSKYRELNLAKTLSNLRKKWKK